MFSRLVAALVCIGVAGCATSHRDRAWLDRQLRERTGAGTCERGKNELPAGVTLEDGLDEAEIVAISLCRNPSLRAELTRIDSAFATLDEARRPANPQLSLVGPIGPVTAVATLLAPIESLWQLPAKTTAAARDADVAGESVLMRALEVVRDARVLHVELGLAGERAAIRAELARIAAEVVRIATVRANTGDISAMEERVLSADARTTFDASESAQTEARMANARLVASLAVEPAALQAKFTTEVVEPPQLAELIAFARAARPDARAAELGVSAATARAGWERTRIINVGALVETQWHQPAGPGLKLGARIDLPIFNWNVGGMGRADADVERAVAQLEMTAQAVVLDVTLASERFAQATKSRQRFEREVLPALDAALEMARRGFETGDQSYLVVLDVLRRAGEARLRHAELIAEQRRALCELERSIGARLQSAAGVASRAKEERGEK